MRRKISPLGGMYIVIAALAVAVLVAEIVPRISTSKEPPTLAGWHRSDELSPPADVPFVGFFVTGGDIGAHTVVGDDLGWFAWEPRLKPPVGTLLYMEPPAWWIEMPGAAK